MARIGEHAVVLGGSMAGLTTAAVLAERFEQVSVVERDVFPALGDSRRGTPQGRHAHVLLPAGVAGLTELLPGFVDDVVAQGGRREDPLALRFHIGGGRLHPVDHDAEVISATRPLIEGVVRERVRALPTVRFVEGCDARGLAVTPDRSRVTGVRLLGRADSSSEEILPADLVVDATGRGSRTPRWLADLGYPEPQEERLQVGVHYVTRLFRWSPGDLEGCTQVVVVGERRGGVAQVVEGDRWLVTLNGLLGERAPTDLDGFAAYARSLWAPDIAAVIATAEPIGDAVTGGYPANTRRRYDRLDRFPDRFAVIGDAVCSFNPVYAQGMSVAAGEALALGEVLARTGLDAVGPRLFRHSRRLVDTAWTLATDSDLSDPDVVGRRTARWRIGNAYLRRLLPVAHRDPAVALAFLKVIGLVAPPQSLLHPRVVWRVATGGRAVGPATEARNPVTAAPARRSLMT
jgi:2-polyprenyl-6-methoxyphenol hydroxylase-like FAD-dependent oxidoreductase